MPQNSNNCIDLHKLLSKSPQLLKDSAVGIERETFRVNSHSGRISQQKHPQQLGSTLTHPQITVDYSESQIELITRPHNSSAEALAELKSIYRWVQQNLPKDQLLWSNSAPCAIDSEEQIQMADFGNSNIGQLKSIYRSGLAQRYGKKMQCVSGIHFNYSLSNNLLQTVAKKQNMSLQDCKTNIYLSMARNVKRFYLLLLPLTGATPAIDASFVKARAHTLKKLDSNSLYLPKATSLRLSDIGYQSSLQDTLNISFNDIERAVQTTLSAILDDYPRYKDLPIQDRDGNQIQLNNHQLQIENEHYSVVRVKPKPQSDKLGLQLLLEKGIEYIELRCLDINPFVDIGIDQTQCFFYEIFLLFCALQPCSGLTRPEVEDIKHNHKKVVSYGLDPNLEMTVWTEAKRHKMPIKQWILKVFSGPMAQAATLLDVAHNCQNYSRTLDYYHKVVEHREPSLVKRILEGIDSDNSFADWAFKLSQQHRQQALNSQISVEQQQYYQQLAARSIQQKHHIEAQSKLPIAQYIHNLYRDYETIRKT